ncbi:hypothetical protein [Gemmatimonas phototrophica]|uniref:DUF5667 domain-containing protein n=1 Tax=Gemmatimonas phototrophica TaxID=1379270 RepID=A0A143BMK9_9BACT|nr:hypothetical protein [Gemmatimonas phototrophica]AMW05730.1 hypothetical protein GEMMAAP_14855 [Gemmatimonas phototrophica]
MTSPTNQPPHNEDDGVPHAPLDPWMLALVRNAADELDETVEVPRDMMWARIQRARREEAETAIVVPAAVTASRRPGFSRYTRQIAAAAAVLVAGVGIGRYVVPSAVPSATAAADSAARAGEALAMFNTDPARVAMQEHLVRTVTLLTSVRDDSPAGRGEAALGPLAKELLTTTRLLLDQPQLRDERTRRLLQDLELVLLQVIQARSTAPETQNAPRETLRETNLLTRVNALVTASSAADGAIYGGD